MFTENFGHLSRQFLASESHQIRGGYHGYVVESEDPFVEVCSSKMDGYGGRDKWPEHVDGQGGFAAAAEAYSQEMKWMYAPPTAFAVRLDAFCNLVPIVVHPVPFMVDPMSFMIVEVIFLTVVTRWSIVELDILHAGPSTLIFASMPT